MIAHVRSIPFGLCFCAVSALGLDARLVPAAGPAVPVKMFAILIGVREYNRLPDLRWSDKDVTLVRDTLRRWCGCEERDIVLMTNQSEEKYKPNRGNIMAVLVDQELKEADEAGVDRVLIYFAGHGLKDAHDNLYLAPQDYVYGRINDTGVSISLVRDALQKCSRIRTKFLILDTCYAGSTRGSFGSLSTEMATKLQDTQGMLTLASCQSDQESLEWNEMGQGLFTYWFCRGLEGAADLPPDGNGDGKVDTDEIERYVTGNVERTAKDLGRPQKPVTIRSKEWQGLPVLAYLSGAADQRQDMVRTWLHVEQSLKYRNGGNFSHALEELERAFRLQPSQEELRQLYALRGRYHVERGKVQEKTDEFQAALGDLDQAISRHHSAAPPHELAAFHTLRSEANYQLRRYDEALRDASEVIRLLPACAQAFRNRATVYRALGDERSAEKDLEAAASLPVEERPPGTLPIPGVESPAIESPAESRPSVTLESP